MSDRIANIFILVEDVAQQNLVRRYLEACGHNLRGLRLLPLPNGKGSGEKRVRDDYARQVAACRSSLGRKTKALLVVMIDADTGAVAQRYGQLAQQLKNAGAAPRRADEPIAVLVPKRHVETWIRALLGKAVDEVNDFTSPAPEPDEIHSAARSLHQMTRPNAVPPSGPPSLVASIQEWQRVP